MKDLLAFIGEHPVITFLIVYMFLFYTVNGFVRLFRAINIARHGWPPSHCDADGDFKPEQKDEDEP